MPGVDRESITERPCTMGVGIAVENTELHISQLRLGDWTDFQFDPSQ